MATRSSDRAWKYFKNPKSHLVYIMWKISMGEIYLKKQYIVDGFWNVTVCRKCPKNVRQEVKYFMEKKNEKDERINMELEKEEFQFGEGYDDDDLTELRAKAPKK